MFHTPGITARTSAGLKLKNVAMTVSAETAPIGADREAKYPASCLMPRRAYDSDASGAK